jgi:hypothetical protein
MFRGGPPLDKSANNTFDFPIAVIDGSAGEYTLNSIYSLATPTYRLRETLRRLRGRLDPRPRPDRWPDDGFKVRLAPGRPAPIRHAVLPGLLSPADPRGA